MYGNVKNLFVVVVVVVVKCSDYGVLSTERWPLISFRELYIKGGVTVYLIYLLSKEFIRTRNIQSLKLVL